MINEKIDNIIDKKLIDWDNAMVDLKLLIDREVYKIIGGEVPSTIGQLYNDILGVLRYHCKEGQKEQIKALEREQMRLYNEFVKPLVEHYGKKAPKFKIGETKSNNKMILNVAKGIYFQAKKGASEYEEAIKSTRK